MSVYVAQFIDDLDGDGVQEILAVHGGDELSDPGMSKSYFLFTFLITYPFVYISDQLFVYFMIR